MKWFSNNSCTNQGYKQNNKNNLKTLKRLIYIDNLNFIAGFSTHHLKINNVVQS